MTKRTSIVALLAAATALAAVPAASAQRLTIADYRISEASGNFSWERQYVPAAPNCQGAIAQTERATLRTRARRHAKAPVVNRNGSVMATLRGSYDGTYSETGADCNPVVCEEEFPWQAGGGSRVTLTFQPAARGGARVSAVLNRDDSQNECPELDYRHGFDFGKKRVSRRQLRGRGFTLTFRKRKRQDGVQGEQAAESLTSELKVTVRRVRG